MASKSTLILNRIKKRRTVMNLAQKIKILDSLARGEKAISVGKAFNVNESTIRTIKKNAEAIRASHRYGTSASMKRTRVARDHNLEKTEQDLHAWIEDQKNRNVPISGSMIREKAKQIYGQFLMQSLLMNDNMKKCREFHASKGWFENFKKRYYKCGVSFMADESLIDDVDESQVEYDENLDVETGFLVKTKVERIDHDPIENDPPRSHYEGFEPVDVQAFPAEDEQLISEAPPAYGSSHRSDSPIRRKFSVKEDPVFRQKKEKMELEIEHMELQNYKIKLEVLKLEKELHVPRSKFTSCFPN